MSVSKIRVFMPGTDVRYEGITVLENLIHSQVDVLTEKQLEDDRSLGKDIKVAFYCGVPGKQIFELYKQGILPNLKLVCNHGVGVNHMPFDFFKEHGLLLTNTPDVLSDATADMAFALMLASGRQFKTGKLFIQGYHHVWHRC